MGGWVAVGVCVGAGVSVSVRALCLHVSLHECVFGFNTVYMCVGGGEGVDGFGWVCW